MVHIRTETATTAGRSDHHRDDEVVDQGFDCEGVAEAAEGGADQWEVVEFPAIFPDTDNVLWPEFWSRDELEGVRASIPVGKWNAQYLQNPTAEEGAIIKRSGGMSGRLMLLHRAIISQSYDTAFTKSERADYSAITTWGIFYPDEVMNLPLFSWMRKRDDGSSQS